MKIVEKEEKTSFSLNVSRTTREFDTFQHLNLWISGGCEDGFEFKHGPL